MTIPLYWTSNSFKDHGIHTSDRKSDKYVVSTHLLISIRYCCIFKSRSCWHNGKATCGFPLFVRAPSIIYHTRTKRSIISIFSYSVRMEDWKKLLDASCIEIVNLAFCFSPRTNLLYTHGTIICAVVFRNFYVCVTHSWPILDRMIAERHTRIAYV